MDGDPYFGKLPAELLGKIAIALPLDEAARTSVLSRRWRSQWRSPALPNSHFAGNGITKFMPDGYPISCFDTVGEFLSWVDQVIRRREPFPLRPARTRLRYRRTEFSIDSLGLNFDPEDPNCGWIEFNKDRSKTTAPLVDGACICCRSKVVSFLSRPQPQPPHGLSLSSLLSGRRRQELLKHLTLRNCDMDIFKFQFASPCSFMFLRSLVVQEGRLIEVKFLWKLIYGFKRLRELTLEDCSIVGDPNHRNQCPGGRLIIVTRSLIHLRLTRCSGFVEIMYVAGSIVRRYAYLPRLHLETIEYHFTDFDRTPPIPEPEPEMPPNLMNALHLEDDDEEIDDEEEATLLDEEEVAYNFYDRLYHI